MLHYILIVMFRTPIGTVHRQFRRRRKAAALPEDSAAQGPATQRKPRWVATTVDGEALYRGASGLGVNGPCSSERSFATFRQMNGAVQVKGPNAKTSILLAPVTYFTDMRPFLNALALFGWLASPAVAQTPPNARLKQELDSLYEVDQRYRAMLFNPRLNRRPDSLAAALGVPKEELNRAIMDRMIRTDATNLPRVEAILRQYGYPGKSLVGVPTNEAAWHVIQHAPALIPQYLPMMKTAAETGELPFRLYATMLDRQLVSENKEQRYGTQAQNYNNGAWFIWPIQNPAQVNQRRQQAGFKTTVEEIAARLGVPYKVLTLEDVAKMPK